MATDPDFLEWELAHNPPSLLENTAKSLYKGASQTLGALADLNPFGFSAPSLSAKQQIGSSIVNALSNYGKDPDLLEWEMAHKAQATNNLMPETYGQQLEGFRQENIGDPHYKTALGRAWGKGWEYAPGMIFPGGSLATRAGLSFLSGIGAQGAEEMGAPEWVGAIGLPLSLQGISGLAKGLIRPLTQTGQKQIVGSAIQEAAGPEGISRLEQALAQPITEPYGAKSITEIAQSPGLANLEKALGKELDVGASLLEAKTARQSAIEEALKETTPYGLQGITSDVKGAFIQPKAYEAAKEAFTTAGKKFEGINKDALIPWVIPKASISAKAKDMFGAGALKMDSEAQAIVNALTTGKATRTFEQLKTLRSQAGSVVGRLARQNPRAQELPILEEIRKQIDNTLELAADTSKGFTPKEAAQYQSALKGYRKTGEIFGAPDIKKITKKGDYGVGFQFPASAVPKEIIKTPENAKQFIKAFGKDAQMVDLARASLLDDMAKKAPASWPKYFYEKRSEFQTLFGKDYSKIKAAMADLSSQESIDTLAQMATGRGSITTQGLSAAKYIATQPGMILLKALGASPTLLAGGVGVGTGSPLGAILAYGAGQLAQKADKGLKSQMAKAFIDRPFAMEAIEAARKGGPSFKGAVRTGLVGALMSQEPKASNQPSFADKNMNDEKPKTPSMMSAKRNDKKAIDLIKEFEGKKLETYNDTGGVKTIGYGHTGEAVKKGKITDEEAEKLLAEDSKKAEKAVLSNVKTSLNESQLAGLTALVFNIGEAAFKRSTLLKKLNAGDIEGAAAEFDRWAYDNGVKLAGLERRRKAEKALFLEA